MRRPVIIIDDEGVAVTAAIALSCTGTTNAFSLIKSKVVHLFAL
jgi:hypothetical protein